VSAYQQCSDRDQTRLTPCSCSLLSAPTVSELEGERNSAIVRGFVAYMVMVFYHPPRVIQLGNGKRKVMINPDSVAARDLFKSNGSGVNRGIPIYALAADGLFEKEDTNSFKPCNHKNAHEKSVPYKKGYEYLSGLWEQKRYEEWFKSFGLEGNDLLLFLSSKDQTGAKRRRGGGN
jgi:hypothetical protein